jgi:hypothetical protein
MRPGADTRHDSWFSWGPEQCQHDRGRAHTEKVPQFRRCSPPKEATYLDSTCG